MEFVELYDGGVGTTSLSGLVVVFYNGNGDTSYAAFDLDDRNTDGAGYFTLGNTTVPGVDLVFNNDSLQNGADAVALYVGDFSQFPIGTPVTTTNLLDAIVYDTDDVDDPGLLVLLNAGQPQVNENTGGGGVVNSNQRCPNGTGGQRNTNTYGQFGPNPDGVNTCTALPTSTPTITQTPSGATATVTSTPGAQLRIRQIQGAAHISAYNGQAVSNVPGIVTARGTNGFWMQDPAPDADDETSEAIFVFTSSAPTVNVGDSVTVSGNVAEFRPGGSGSTNLTTTEITGPIIALVSTGNPTPTAVIIGTGGRIPPNNVIDDDATGDVETSGTFDAATDGIDFYESMEGMRVQVNNPVAVSPRNSFGEIAVLGDDGANASVRTNRGGIVIRPGDFNPERVILDDVLISTPNVHVGDHFSGPARGVLDYSFGNFKLLITASLTRVTGPIAREVAATPVANQLTVGNFNVENLDPNDGPAKFNALAGLIVNNLRSPDILALEEIQDNNGAINDGTVAADVTYNMLIAAIQSQGGPTYQFRQIDPLNNQDGGEPGGNIRVGFLYRTDRGVGFVDRPGGNATRDTLVLSGPSGPYLDISPGRVWPTATAWTSSRKPLAGEFTYNGHTLFLIANHFNSKGGDHPLFGRFQPPVLNSEVQRTQQAQLVNNFVDQILAIDGNAKVIVLGDLNDFEWSTPLVTLTGGVMQVLIERLPQPERYSYVFDGNSQSLDHIVVSNALSNTVPIIYDIVHINSEFYDQESDHDPSVAYLSLPAGATATPTAACAIVEIASKDVPKTIGPNLGTVTTSTLTVAQSLIIDKIEVVGVNITHTFANDLDVFLINPSRTITVELFTDLCGSLPWPEGSTGFTLNQRSSNLIGSACPPGQDVYRPEGNLDALVGTQAQGVWELRIVDDANQDNGGLLGWGLRFTSGAGCVTKTPNPSFTPTVTRTPTNTRTPTLTRTVTQTRTATSVASTATNTTVAATATGTGTGVPSTATVTGTAGASPTGTVCPPGQQLLLIPDWTADRVMAFDPVTGNLVNADFIPTDAVNLASPKNAILSAAGNTILVSDQIRDVVQEFSLAGTFIRTFAPAGGPNPAILDNILGITLRPNGNLLVTVTGGANTDSVAEFDTNGNYIGNFIAQTSGGVDGPFDILYRTTTTGTDYLVPAINSDAVHRYSDTGSFLNIFAPVNSFPEQISLGRVPGNVLVANFSGTQTGILEYTEDGTFVGRYTGATGNRGVYELPNGNFLTTTGTSVVEVNRSNQIVSTKATGVNAQYIELVSIGGACGTPTVGPSNTAVSTATRTNTATVTVTRTSTPGACQITEYKSADVPKTIGPTNPVTSTLNIAGSGILDKVEGSGIVISHTNPSDLDVFLISPQGTRVELFTDVCGSGDWLAGNTYFDLNQSAANLIGSVCPPRSGTSTGRVFYRPEGNLDALVGQNANGVWTLEITDDTPAAENGVLYGWGLRITRGGVCPTKTPNPFTSAPVPSSGDQ
jgi:predicted extracellular nuclease/subtilisin-like proprotein convertase family protein